MCSHRRLPSGSAGVSTHLPRRRTPAVERAAQAVRLDAAVGEVGAAMRAVALDQPIAVRGFI